MPKHKSIKSSELDLKEKVIDIQRVVKVVKGGRILSFRALVVLGDMVNTVGYGIGKARDVPKAVNKAKDRARSNLSRILLTSHTIPHSVRCKFKCSHVVLNPAFPGRGIVAGGPMRSVLELAGVGNISGKTRGSNNACTVVAATLKALKSLSDACAVAKRRGISIEKVFNG